MTLIAREQPRGHAVRSLRESVGLERDEFAEPLHINAEKLKNYEIEKRGVLMPEATWLLARITYDPLAREQWNKSTQRRRRMAAADEG